jgi:hypothetical protein
MSYLAEVFEGMTAPEWASLIVVWLIVLTLVVFCAIPDRKVSNHEENAAD